MKPSRTDRIQLRDFLPSADRRQVRPVSGDAENGKVFAKAPRNTFHNPMKRFMRSRTIWEGNRHLGLRGQFERVLLRQYGSTNGGKE